MPRRLLVSLLLAVALTAAALAPALAPAAPAKVPVCGTADADGDTVLGTLALNANSSTAKDYGRGGGDHRLALLYDVTGCVLPAGTTIPADQVTILPAKAGDDLPGAPAVAVTVDRPDPTALAATVALKLDDIDPGTRGGIVRIHLPQYLHDSFTPISESRTDTLLWPLLFGLLGALGGLLWGVTIHFAKSVDVSFSRRQGVLLAVLTIGAGLVAGYGYWHNQDVWTIGENAWATITAGFAASTTGALATVTTAIFSPPKKDADAAAAAPPPAQQPAPVG
jgi:hypothetical protein